MTMKAAVCLLSGGLDSATTLFYTIKENFRVLALTVDYGQIHRRELESAKKITNYLKIEHEIISIELPWKGSALLDETIPIPQNRDTTEISKEIPVTYVPARNTIFLSLAASYAEVRGASAIFIGANAIDYSGYPDCRPEYFKQMETAICLGTKAGVEGARISIETPLIHLTKAEIIKLATQLGVPLEWTWSCYRGDRFPCENCDACFLRKKGFAEAGIDDPLFSSVKE